MVDELGGRSVQPAPQVLLQELPDGEIVLLNTRTEQYFGLDAMGARMWQALASRPTVADAEAALMEQVDVDPARLQSDLADFIEQLEERQLVVLDDA